MKDLIAAIDLGTTKTVVVVGEKTNLGVKVLAFGEAPSRGIKRGRIENVKFAHQSLEKALRKVEEQIGMTVRKAFVGIAGQDIKCLAPEPFMVQRKDFNALISQQEIMDITASTYNTAIEDGYKVFYSVPQAYNVDNYMSVSDPVGMIGRNIVARYKLFAGKENSIRMINSTLGLSGIEPIEIVLEPIASAKAVLTDDEMEVGSVLVDIGGGTTDVIVYHHNVIRYAGIIPFGGNSVTEDICTGCGIATEKAEYIKTNYGCSFSDYADALQKVMIPSIGSGNNKEIQIKTLSRIIQARMEEILEAVCWHVEQSDFKDKIRSGLVLTGGGSKIKNLPNLADFVTGLETRVGTPNAFALDPSSCEEAKDSTASTAVGMLIHALQRMEDEGIFFPGCVTDISAKEPAAASQPEMEPVFAEPAQDAVETPVQPTSGTKSRGNLFKGFGKKIKQAFDSENLFNSGSNEV